MIYLIFFLAEIFLLYFISQKLHKEISAFIYKVTKSKKWTIYIMAVVFLPGTIIHELSHAVSALFLLVPFENVEFIPEIQGKDVKLGSVRIAKTDPLRSFLISSAPLTLGVLLILYIFYFIFQLEEGFSLWSTLISLYAAFEIGNSMYLSKSDTKGMLGLVILLVIFFIVLYLLGVNISLNTNNLLKFDLGLLFKKASLFMLFPVAIDTLLIKIIKLTTK